MDAPLDKDEVRSAEGNGLVRGESGCVERVDDLGACTARASVIYGLERHSEQIRHKASAGAICWKEARAYEH